MREVLTVMVSTCSMARPASEAATASNINIIFFITIDFLAKLTKYFYKLRIFEVWKKSELISVLTIFSPTAAR